MMAFPADSRGPSSLQGGNAGRDRWMASYMDVVTILLILFIAASAQTVGNGAAAPAGSEEPGMAPDARQIHRADADPRKPAGALLHAQERLRTQGLDLRMEPRGLVITLPQAILFPSGTDRISASAFPIISRLADVLKEVPNRVLLVGHADAVPIHDRRFRNNWELSSARSMRLLEMFTDRFGVPESKLALASYGSNSPKGPNDTADGRAGNRRVEIVILGEPAGG